MVILFLQVSTYYKEDIVVEVVADIVPIKKIKL